METNDWIEQMRDINSNALWPTGFADAITGIFPSQDEEPARFVVDSGKILQILIDEHDMTEEDALEYYYYNIYGAYMGKHQPIYNEPDSWGTLE